MKQFKVFFIACSMVFSLAFVTGPQTKMKKYTIEQFLNTKSYFGGEFSCDENKILYSSNETGIFNVYSKDLHDQDLKQTQLTFSKSEAAFLVASLPGNDRFLYMSDHEGNEITHLFLHNSDGSTKDLTPYAQSRVEFVGSAHDRKSFYYACNVRDPKFMDLYEMDVATFTPKLIYKNDGYRLGSISPNKRYLSLNKIINSNNAEIYLYDFVTKTLKNITVNRVDIQNVPQSFSVDSKFLYFLSDENSEFKYLKSYDIAKGTFETREKYDWDILSSTMSHDGRYRITQINEDGKIISKVFDENLKKQFELPKIPEGHIGQVVVSDSSKAMLFVGESDRTPRDYYHYDVASKKLLKLTNALNPEINPNDLVEAEIIRYASYDGKLIPALYYKPHGIKKNQKMRALIWVHGGPGGQSIAFYNSDIQFLVNHGYAILAVNNRGSSGYGKTFFKAADHQHGALDLDDCIWAKKFLISTGNIDEERTGIIGGSYGGYMTLAALAFRSNEMAVGVDLFGVANWVRTLKSVPVWWESEREMLYKKIGNPYTEADYLNSISPLFYAGNIKKPLLVIQGANDPRVLKIESDQIIEEVNKNGVPNEYLVFDDEGHGFSKKKNQITTANTILRFLEKYL
jgi:dipeptidyl aminopeptidase/acylaminoacyl peptidase